MKNVYLRTIITWNLLAIYAHEVDVIEDIIRKTVLTLIFHIKTIIKCILFYDNEHGLYKITARFKSGPSTKSS